MFLIDGLSKLGKVPSLSSMSLWFIRSRFVCWFFFFGITAPALRCDAMCGTCSQIILK